MDELKFLDPNSEGLSITSKAEDLSPEIRYLCTFAISRYNEAVDTYSEGDNDAAWKNISDSISIFPYINITLHFGFLLSLEIGEYKKSSIYLQSLKYFVTESQLTEYENLLAANVNEFNSLLQQPISDPKIDDNTPLIHALIIGLKHPIIRNSYRYQQLVQNTNNSVPVDESLFKSIHVRALIYVCVVLGFTSYLAIYDSLENKHLAAYNIGNVTDYSEQLYSEYLNLTKATSTQKSLNEFFIAFHAEKYEKCGNILNNQPQLVDTSSLLDPQILDKLCSALFYQKNYKTLSSINFASSYHIHSDYFLIKNAVGDDRRLRKISFIKKYSNSPNYVPPILRELYDTEINIQKRSDYVERLDFLIKKYPEEKIKMFMSREMATELEI
jgi:hypothetical protein